MTRALLRTAYLSTALTFSCTIPNATTDVNAYPAMSQDPSDDVSQEPVEEPITIRYIEQANGIRIPDTDWDRGEIRYLQLSPSGFLDRYERIEGRINHDGHMFCCRMDLVDSNNDGTFDLARLTVDYRIKRHRIWGRWGRLEQGRAIIQDQNHDGITDVMWQDIYDGRRRGIDGIYERQIENEGGNPSIEYQIKRWIIFVRAPR